MSLSIPDVATSNSGVPEHLHPSWEASRKRKETSGIQAFKGKKIKFDDDDG